jgi:uncharacterized protein (DUF1330 family)
MRHANGMPEIPVVNCVLLWARPGMEAALSAYEDKVLRLVAEHGGRVLERGTVLPGSQHDGEPPAEVQFLEMPSEASLDAYVNDPRRLAMAAERDAAIARTDLFRIQPVSRPAPERQEIPGGPCWSFPESRTRPGQPFCVTAAAVGILNNSRHRLPTPGRSAPTAWTTTNAGSSYQRAAHSSTGYYCPLNCRLHGRLY